MKFSWITLMAVGAIATLTSCTGNEPIDSPQKVITIGGSAEAYEAMELLTEAYAAQGSTIEFQFLNNSQSSGGIQGVKDGVLDIGLTSRDLTPEEMTDRIQYQAIANFPMHLGTNERVDGIADLTREQIKAIYTGKIDNWQQVGGENAEIIVLDLPEDETEKQLLRRYYLDDRKISDRAILISDDDTVMEVLESTPYSIGIVPQDYDLTKTTIDILTIDGTPGTVENVRNGTYKLVYTVGMVVAAQPTPATETFLNYIVSDSGKQVLESAGYVAIEQP